MARVERVHAPGARRHGVRRGDVDDPPDRDRRALGAAAGAAGRPRARRADGLRRPREPVHAHEHRVRDRVAGLLGGMRAEAGAPWWPRHERRPLRQPPQPALHRRLRDARLGGRRRGRRAGDVAAVGRASTAAMCATRAHTSSASSPARRSTACGRSRAGARTTSGNGCPSPCSRARTSRRTSSSRRASRSRC